MSLIPPELDPGAENGETGTVHVSTEIGMTYYVDTTQGAQGSYNSLTIRGGEMTKTASGQNKNTPYTRNGPVLHFEDLSRPSRVTYHMMVGDMARGSVVNNWEGHFELINGYKCNFFNNTVCGGRGVCDKGSGRCQCGGMHYGDACQFTRCIDPTCNGFGSCAPDYGRCNCTIGHLDVSRMVNGLCADSTPLMFRLPELENPGPAPLASCTFETTTGSTTCGANGWKDDKPDPRQMSWTIHTGATASPGTGPPRDHTRGGHGLPPSSGVPDAGVDGGSFMLLEGTSPTFGFGGGYGHLLTARKWDAASKRNALHADVRCMSFWYYMEGMHVGALSVDVLPLVGVGNYTHHEQTGSAGAYDAFPNDPQVAGGRVKSAQPYVNYDRARNEGWTVDVWRRQGAQKVNGWVRSEPIRLPDDWTQIRFRGQRGTEHTRVPPDYNMVNTTKTNAGDKRHWQSDIALDDVLFHKCPPNLAPPPWTSRRAPSRDAL